jgi:hypothetical protein
MSLPVAVALEQSDARTVLGRPLEKLERIESPMPTFGSPPSQNLLTRRRYVERASPTALHANRSDMLNVVVSMLTARRLTAGLTIFQ